MSDTIRLGNLEFYVENGSVTVFTYDLMKAIPFDPSQTLALYSLLDTHKNEIEKAADAQHTKVPNPQPRTLEERIDNLFS